MQKWILKHIPCFWGKWGAGMSIKTVVHHTSVPITFPCCRREKSERVREREKEKTVFFRSPSTSLKLLPKIFIFLQPRRCLFVFTLLSHACWSHIHGLLLSTSFVSFTCEYPIISGLLWRKVGGSCTVKGKAQRIGLGNYVTKEGPPHISSYS